jgi:hypothetical protein
MDGSIPYQQKLSNFQIATVALKARSNRLRDTAPLMPSLMLILPKLLPGTLTVLSL